MLHKINQLLPGMGEKVTGEQIYNPFTCIKVEGNII